MKRFIVYGLVLIIGMVFCVGACNTPDSNPGGDDGPGEDIDLTFEGDGDGTGQLFAITGDGDYPGLEITLTGEILDISKYSQVIIDATLYSDAAGTTKSVEPTEPDADKNLAQCKLLKAGGGTNWEPAASNVCANNYTKSHMVIDGKTTMDIPSGSSGVPKVLLVQANYEKNKDAVKSIKVRSISFVAKKDDFRLVHIFGTSATINGNKIIFENASYSNGASGSNWVGSAGVGSAVLLVFPEDAGVGDALKDKTIKINFTIEAHTCPNTTPPKQTEHQLNVQAAQDTPEKDMFNGQNPEPPNKPGQKYITLDSNSETDYDTETGTGTMKISANDMIAASKANISGDDGKGPFTLDSVRISNNGTYWDETKDGVKIDHYRCKSYTLVINSVTIE